MTELVVTNQRAPPRCYGNGMVCAGCRLETKRFMSRCQQQSLFPWEKASEMQSSGVSSSNVVPVTVLQYRRKAFFCLHPRVLSMGLTIGTEWAWKHKTVSDQRSFYHTPPQSARGLVTLLGDARHRYHTSSLSHPLSSGRVCSHSIATDVPLAHPLNTTPPRYGTPQLRGSCACCLLPGVRKVAHTPRKSTPGDNVFKCDRNYHRGVLSSVLYGISSPTSKKLNLVTMTRRRSPPVL